MVDLGDSLLSWVVEALNADPGRPNRRNCCGFHFCPNELGGEVRRKRLALGNFTFKP